MDQGAQEAVIDALSQLLDAAARGMKASSIEQLVNEIGDPDLSEAFQTLLAERSPDHPRDGRAEEALKNFAARTDERTGPSALALQIAEKSR